MILGDCGWFWVVVTCFGWLQLVSVVCGWLCMLVDGFGVIVGRFNWFRVAMQRSTITKKSMYLCQNLTFVLLISVNID